MVKKKLSKFERTQFYRMMGKPTRMWDLSFKFRNELLDLETPAESIFKSYLIRMRIKFEFQKIIYAGKSFYIVDFYLPRKNIVVEVDGFHHSNIDKFAQDLQRTKNLKKSGIREVHRFLNNEVFSEITCIDKIKSILK